MVRCLAILLCAVIGIAAAEQYRANPIRKVVGMLQDMQKSVEEEGEKEKQLFEQFMCYCNNGAGSLDNSIATAAQQIESLTGQVASETAQKSQMEQDTVQHKADRVEAEKTIKESTAMREKEASEFAASSGEMKANIAAMTNALAALRKGLSASLLQTAAGITLRNIIQNSPAVNEGERSTLMSFLETGEGGSDQIIGVVDQMKETMEADLKQSTSDEETAKASFTSLVASKEKEIAAAGKAIEDKTARVGELAVSVVQGKADLKDTEEAKAEDEKFKANLAASCKTKSAEWDERQKIRSQEIEAISETIEMLNGDDALELFKKTLPSSAAFIQLSTASRTRMQRAAMLLKKFLARNPTNSLSLRNVLLMLNSHTHGFGTVIKMVDGMIATNEKEQADEDQKRDFCMSEIQKTEDKVKEHQGTVSDLEADISQKEDEIATLGSEIAAIQKGIEDLDKSVVQATEQRKAEHAEYTSTAAANQAALELIGMAQNRMNKFYAPSQYKAPPTTTVSDSPYGFVQLSLRRRADPGPAPEMPSGEYKKNEKSGGVLAMMGQMMKDVEMDLAEGKRDEESAQKDYEEAMKDAATKRSDDTKLMVEKQGGKSELEVNMQSVRADRSTKSEQLGLSKDKLYDLEIDCTHLLESYDESKKNRAAEVDMLKQSKAVLQGASPGFLQK